jgi:hypothetical protein
MLLLGSAQGLFCLIEGRLMNEGEKSTNGAAIRRLISERFPSCCLPSILMNLPVFLPFFLSLFLLLSVSLATSKQEHHSTT